MVQIQNKNTYCLGSYHQPYVAHQAGLVSKTGADVLGYTNQHVDRQHWVAKEEAQGCYSLTNKASQGTRFVLVDTGNTVTVEPFDINGKRSQQWVIETTPERPGWGHIINRETQNYLQFNGEPNKLTCVTYKYNYSYQYWCLGLVSRGTDGDWLDSLEPKAATTPVNTNSVTNAENTSTAHETSVVHYNNPTSKTVVTGGDAHESSYAEVLQLKLQLYEAQLRHQQEQLAEKDRQLAARGLTANSYGTGGLGGNVNGLENIYGNGTGGFGGSVNDLSYSIYGNGTAGQVGDLNGVGNGVAGLSDVDIRNAALHGKLNILQIEIRHKQNQIFDAAKAPGDHTHVDTAILSKEKELAEQAHNHVIYQLKEQVPVK